MDQDQQLRDQLVKLMNGGQAFQPHDVLLRGITISDAGQTIAGLPYTLWQLIEHMRISLFDILDFTRDPKYVSPEWPNGYWPKETVPADVTALETSIQAISDGIEAMEQLVQDVNTDLYKPFDHGTGQNLLREAMLVAEHTAYHLGQVVLMRRLLGNWT